MRRRPKRGQASSLLETAMWVPFLVLLLMGMTELARVSYTYFTLHKVLYSAARAVGTRQGVNFCDDTDTTIETAKNFALRGTQDASADPILPGLTADQIEIRIERRNTENSDLEECQCSESGCDLAAGGISPEFIVVSVPDGYPIRLVFPGLTLDPIPLRAQVRVPFGGS